MDEPEERTCSGVRQTFENSPGISFPQLKSNLDEFKYVVGTKTPTFSKYLMGQLSHQYREREMHVFKLHFSAIFQELVGFRPNAE